MIGSIDILSQIKQFNIGPITFHTYGLIIGISIVVLLSYINNKLPRDITQNSKYVFIIIITIISSIIGARVFYVIIHWEAFQAGDLAIINITNGGLNLFGIFAFGLLTLYICHKTILTHITDYKFTQLTDIVFTATALAQSIGRWANFINQELFGPPTNLPWKIYIPPNLRPPQYSQQNFFHPAFLYESVLNLINFLILHYLLSRKRKQNLNIHKNFHSLHKNSGQITAMYMLNYGIIRIFTERFRLDTQPILYLFKINDILSTILIMAGLYGLYLIKNRANRYSDKQSQNQMNNKRKRSQNKNNKSITCKEITTKIAIILTSIFSPVTSCLLIAFLIYHEAVPHDTTSLLLWVGLLSMTSLSIYLIMKHFIKTGKISDWSISKRSQRPRIFFIMLFFMVSINLITYLAGYHLAAEYLFLPTIGFTLAFLITTIWKISIHTFSVSLAVGFIILLYATPYATALIVLPLITAWTRVILKKHTISQALGGIALAFALYSGFAIMML